MAACFATLAAQGSPPFLYGQGCSSRYASFYEQWPPGMFDLIPATGVVGGYTMVRHATGYIVIPLTGSWIPPDSTATPLSFDAQGMSLPTPLGFDFHYPGGQTSNIWVGNDGFVCLAPTPYQAVGLPPIGRLFRGAPCVAAFWSDFVECNCGAITVQRDWATNSFAVVTWNQVTESGSNYTSSFQVVLHASGQIDIVLAACQANSHSSISGWSAGSGALSCPPSDLSALNAVTIITFPDREAMLLETGDVPHIGASVNMETQQIPEPVKQVFTMLGAYQFLPGIDMTVFGATGCELLASYDFAVLTRVVFGSAVWTLPIPADPLLIGQSAYLQSFGFDLNANPAGLLFSNGYQLLVTP